MLTRAAVPAIPTMETEPMYTTGTINQVRIAGGLGAAQIEYQFCRLPIDNDA